jgi:hypothetical protein
VHPPHSAIAPGASACPLFSRPGQGENPPQADHGSPLPPESALLATKSRGACSRLFRPRTGERQPRAAAPRTRPWAGRSGGGPLARVAGELCRGGGRRLTARNLRPYAYLNRRRRASLIRPAKRPVRRLAGSNEGFWDDCPLPWPIVRMAGAAARLSPPGGTGPRVSCTAGPRSSAGLLGAGTSPQPGLTVVQAG